MTITNCTQAFNALYNQFPTQATREKIAKTLPLGKPDKEDNELLTMAKASTQKAEGQYPCTCGASSHTLGELFIDRYNGLNTHDGNDVSRADYNCCLTLAYWTRGNREWMKRLIEPRYREKFDDIHFADDRTYLEGLLDAAIADCHTTRPPEKGVQGGEAGKGTSPRPFNCTDLGNAERFAARYKDTVRWCEDWKKWVVFTGKCWEVDKAVHVDALAKAVVRAIYKDAALEDDEAKRKKIVKHGLASESNRAVRAMLDRAKSELPILPDAFNRQPHLINCNNGTLNLRTGELKPHNAQDFLTRCIKLDYNFLARCPLWEHFLATIFAGDRTLIEFIIQALGMSLSGDTSEQCLFICHGGGNNGKTTMLEIVRIILASYGLAANIETFQVRKNETVRNDIAELYGARLVTAEENMLGSRLNEAFVKKATGKQPLRARRLHENEFEFMPEFTLWLAVNHKPEVKDTTRGMWRRVHFVPFHVTIPEEQVDKHFAEKLLAGEAEGIFALLVQGCMAWYEAGRLSVPEAVENATRAYRAENDPLASFLESECIFAENLKAGATELTERYEHWCKANSEQFEARDLKRALNERGFHSKRGHGGTYVYHGVGLLTVEAPEPNTILIKKG